jgi:hypothetical protein
MLDTSTAGKFPALYVFSRAGSLFANGARLQAGGRNLVEPKGFEPSTSSMPSRRASNCATAPPEDEFL